MLTNKFKGSCVVGGCVQVKKVENVIFVRDSKNPNGPVLEFSEKEWDTFLDAAKKREFDIE